MTTTDDGHGNGYIGPGLLALWLVTTSLQDFLADSHPARWETLYETAPCLHIMWENKYPFAGDGAGGRMIESGARHILLTVGDFRFNGVDATPALAQDPESAYGKIIEIDTADGSSRIFTSGHRTPQGFTATNRAEYG